MSVYVNPTSRLLECLPVLSVRVYYLTLFTAIIIIIIKITIVARCSLNNVPTLVRFRHKYRNVKPLLCLVQDFCVYNYTQLWWHPVSDVPTYLFYQSKTQLLYIHVMSVLYNSK